MDVYPVTNSEYLSFVKEHLQWQRSKVKRLFSDGSYLANWKGDTSLGDLINPNAPVTNISWFTAKNYCEVQGKRLPTVDEWEYAAMVDEITADARKKERKKERKKATTKRFWIGMRLQKPLKKRLDQPLKITGEYMTSTD